MYRKIGFYSHLPGVKMGIFYGNFKSAGNYHHEICSDMVPGDSPENTGNPVAQWFWLNVTDRSLLLLQFGFKRNVTGS